MLKFKSIRTKLLTYITIIIAALAFVFIYLSIDTLMREKQNILKENLSYENAQILNDVNTFFQDIFTSVSLIETFANSDPENNSENAQFFTQFLKLESFFIQKADETKVYYDRETKFDKTFAAKDSQYEYNNEIYKLNFSKDFKILRVSKVNEKEKLKIVFYYTTNKLSEIFSEIIGRGKGVVLLGDQSQFYYKVENIEEQSPATELAKPSDGFKTLTLKEINVTDGGFIVACNYTDIDLKICNFISKQIANQLLFKVVFDYSLYFIFLLSTILIILIFTMRKFTKPIEKLTQNALAISNGNFNVACEVKTVDEVGQLSSSFNYMTKKLIEYINEVKDKVRIEEELNVANTVQNYFFPKRDLIRFNREFEFMGIHETASECGGDWWGVQEYHGKIVIFLGDATGHGVPSALITSAVYSSSCLLEELFGGREQNLNPHTIMEILNKTVYNLGQQILMTFVVFIIDTKTKQLSYCNASHNFPFLIQGDSALVLQDNLGSRLGENINSKYQSSSLQLQKGDTLLLYTDGVTEAANDKGRLFGEKKLLRILKKNKSSNPKEILDTIRLEVQNYTNESMLEDDLTMACMRVL
ncbi:MAG: SpoIIE family protein phosphatase [Halobacteriovoraceae bacterium]|nr:SpoIIE family protein phosphatase [Halobacteriovoraceae bacterium]MCB9095169.1 SpoIIE family protein phosphatase [Halobacteriovoraceae bacterium]